MLVAPLLSIPAAYAGPLEDAQALLDFAIALKLSGKITAAAGKTTATGAIGKSFRPGVHGYASLAIENDLAATLGKLMDGVADAMLSVSGAGSALLNHREVLAYQRTLLEEVCMLSRFCSASCQRWHVSPEADAVRNPQP